MKIHTPFETQDKFPEILGFYNIGERESLMELQAVSIIAQYDITELYCSSDTAMKFIDSKTWFKDAVVYNSSDNTLELEINPGTQIIIKPDPALDNLDMDFLTENFLLIKKEGELYPFLTGMKF
jgi:hypothetical protein